MKRVSIVAAALVLVTAVFASLAPGLAAQTPVALPVTPIDQLALRIVEGNGYAVLTDSLGQPQQGEVHQVQEGVFPTDMNPVVSENYARHNTRDVYITFANLVPPGQDPAGEVLATSVEIRVATFANADSAAGYVTTLADELPRQAEVLGTNPTITPFEVSWDREGAIAGFDGFDTYSNVDTGEPVGDVPYTRVLAQVGTVVASAKVSGQPTPLNSAIALELLITQVMCIEADVPCEAIPVPVKFPNSPDLVTTTVSAATANVRAEPSTSAAVVMTVTTGTTLVVTGEPVEADGYTWLPVSWSQDFAGWIADQLVTPVN